MIEIDKPPPAKIGDRLCLDDGQCATVIETVWHEIDYPAITGDPDENIELECQVVYDTDDGARESLYVAGEGSFELYGVLLNPTPAQIAQHRLEAPMRARARSERRREIARDPSPIPF